MNNTDMSIPLTAHFVTDNLKQAPRREDHVRPAGYEARLALLADTWGVELDTLLHKSYKGAVEYYDGIEKELDDFAALPLPAGEELRSMTDAQRRKALRDVETDNVARAQVRASIRENLTSARRVIDANEVDELTYKHVMSVLPVAETVDTLKRTAKFLGPYTTHTRADAEHVANAASRAERAAAAEVLPEFHKSLYRLLALDLLVSPNEAYALWADPGISGFLEYRVNVNTTGKPISKIEDFTDVDIAAHRVAEDYREVFLGGFAKYDRRGPESGKEHREVGQHNQFKWSGISDRVLTPLARGMFGGLEVSVPATWDELQDRIRRFSEANRRRESRDGRFSADEFRDRENSKKNPVTGEWETTIQRTNLRDGSVQYISVGKSVPQPSFAPQVERARS
ncbi:hypothetical protein ACT3S7_12585 [Corynebacterium sp. AOP34-AQ2-28]|uniref:hypothetical protein n=1 Tax=Corynebacterium sp. AOP34-AQ2-28 TaxID=3457689 RepID=UPI0040343BF9